MSENNNEYVDIYSHSDMEKKKDANNNKGVVIISESENEKGNIRRSIAAGKTEPAKIKRTEDPYDNAEEVSFVIGKKKNKSSTAIKVFSVILVILLLGAGACAAAVLTDGFGMMKKESESSQLSETKVQESKPEPSIEEEEEVSEESEEEKINFISDAKFTKKADRLSASVKKALDNEVQSSNA